MMNIFQKLYSGYSEHEVAANKKLPLPCFGNFKGYGCSYECEESEDCYSATMTKWGECDCEYKSNCTIQYQEKQSSKMKNNKDYECQMKQHFDDDDKPKKRIIIDGIIKMKPWR